MLKHFQTKLGKFESGWSGFKICNKCNKKYLANSGSQIICSKCFPKCIECSKIIADRNRTWKKFCGTSCAGKWRYKNCKKVKYGLKFGVINASRKTKLKMGKSISISQTGKPKLNQRGKNNPNWKGGTYGTERHRIMGQVEYKNWRKEVFIRDDYTCQICFKRGGKLQADHIIPYSFRKDLALNLSNGRTLCVNCHRKTDTYGNGAKNFVFRAA